MLFGTPKVEVTVKMPMTDAFGTAGPATDSDKVIVKIITIALKSIWTPYIFRNMITAIGM